MDDFDRRYMDKVFAIHTAMDLEAENDNETKVWHLIRVLLEWADDEKIDFDLLVEDAREDFRLTRELVKSKN